METPDPIQDLAAAMEASGTAAGVPAEPAESASARLEGQLQEAQDRYLRLAAEFDNFRKRVARERVELADRAQAALVMKLLDVLDDLDRLATQDLSQTSRDVLHEALLLVDRKLRKELGAAGLERLDPAGSVFDPSLHEAVSVLAPPDPSLDHTVSATFQAGYQFKGSLVRPARVQVYSAEAGA
jgi:molecular chaperone GrpE